MCARDADDFYAWASTDDRVAGVLTWNYGGCAACNGSHWTPPHTCCMDEIGSKDMPLAKAAWEAAGAKLIRAAGRPPAPAAPIIPVLRAIAEVGRADPGRADPGRAEPGRAEPGRTYVTRGLVMEPEPALLPLVAVVSVAC